MLPFLQDIIILFALLSSFVEFPFGQRITFSTFTANSTELETVQDISTVDETLRLNGLSGVLMGQDQSVFSICDRNQALNELSSVQSVALVDGSCSQVAEHLSRNKNQTVMIIFSSTSASINNGSVTTGTFRTVPSDRALPSALGLLLREYQLKQLSIVSSQSSQYIELKRLILNTLRLEPEETRPTVTQVDVNHNEKANSAARLLFDKQPHIYYLNTDLQTGVFFLCEGFMRSRYYPNYLWIVPGWWNNVGGVEEWWESPSLLSKTLCTSANLRKALYRSLILTAVPSDVPEQDAPMISTNITGDKFSLSSYFLDAILALTLAVNNTNSPQNITYNHLVENLTSVAFHGATGFVKFKENGDRDNIHVVVQQFRTDTSGRLTVVDVAAIKNSSYTSALNESEESVFPEGPPPDGTPLQRNNTVAIPIIVIVMLMCFVGLVLTAFCLLFNIFFRDKKIVKLTSPNLNYLLLSGVFILLLGMVFYVIPTTDQKFMIAICTLHRFLVSFGHDVAFAVALVKTWRIHYIFRNPSPSKRAPKDWQLFMCAFLMVLVDLIISIILFIPDNIFNEVGLVKDSERPSITNEQGVRVNFYAPSCGRTPYYLAWIGFTAIFKITLHVIAVVLAFRIRNIKVDTLNDFRFTSAIVYTSTVLILILVLVVVIATDYKNTFATLVPTLVFLEVLVFLSLSFVPKMVALYKDPHGIHVFDKPQKRASNPLAEASESLKRNIHHSKNNSKDTSIKDPGEDSGRCTLDSKEKENQTNNIKETKFNKNDENGVQDLLVINQNGTKNLPDERNEAKTNNKNDINIALGNPNAFDANV